MSRANKEFVVTTQTSFSVWAKTESEAQRLVDDLEGDEIAPGITVLATSDVKNVERA